MIIISGQGGTYRHLNGRVTGLLADSGLKNNLYRLWNRMSSGSYFPPPVKAVEIPKASGGVRILGVATGIANCPVVQAG